MQKEFAEQLVHELGLCGHDDIHELDILDALASTGLVLAPALHGNGPGEEYQEEIRRNIK